MEATGGAGVDRVIDVWFGANAETDLAVLKVNGVVASYSVGGPEEFMQFPFSRYMSKGITLHTIYVYGMSREAHWAAVRDTTAALRAGVYRPRIGARFPLCAHRRRARRPGRWQRHRQDRDRHRRRLKTSIFEGGERDASNFTPLGVVHGTCRRRRIALPRRHRRSAPTAMLEVEVRERVEYVKHDGVALTGDLYVPKAPGKYPIVVAAHGGGWQVGNSGNYRSWGNWLAARGICPVRDQLSPDEARRERLSQRRA